MGMKLSACALSGNNGIFMLYRNGTRAGTMIGTGTIRSNGYWSLSPSRTTVNMSTWYCTFYLVPVLNPTSVSISVNDPLAV